MHLHILGIGGTFMGSLALLARTLGHRVSGCDRNLYPPMSTQLASAGIAVREGYEAANLQSRPDLVVVGNVMTRGYPIVEALLDSDLPYTSGPQWLAEHVLPGRHTLAVAGTHGKTTTSSMLAWILETVGLAPGFLIGGIPRDFGVSARLGTGRPFVLEADEYDTAFFDKRAKFIHYRPRILVLNNLEFDHADIYSDLTAIQRQFHHLVRTVPGQALIVSNASDPHLEAVLAQGCWTPVVRFLGQGDWQVMPTTDGGEFFHGGTSLGRLRWSLSGRHNLQNALAALVAASDLGIEPSTTLAALARFGGVKRRQEIYGEANGVTVLDDFAHHPTAIRETLAGLRERTDGRLIAVLEPRSNTMRLGVLQAPLGAALKLADGVVLHCPAGLSWDPAVVLGELPDAELCDSIDGCVSAACRRVCPGDLIVVMSNGGFGGIHQRLLDHLADNAP